MRKLLALLILVPFAAVVVLSCDDHPTAPEEAQAATTVQESSTPQAAAKAPTLPTPVVLSGAEVITGPYAATSNLGETVYSYAACPDGKIPLSGGYMVNADPDTEDFLVMQNTARRVVSTTGWSTGIKLTAGSFLGIASYAVCIDAVVTLD
jgi:hypothetical protein